MRAVVLAADEQLCHDHSVVGSATQGSDPPLGSCQGGRVNSEGLVLRVPGGGGLQSTHIRAVAQFRLCIASQYLVVLCRLEEEFVLLGGTLFPQGDLSAVFISF